MRVLIATATAGGGHLAAAAALMEAWQGARPEDVIECLDVVKFFSPLHRKIHADGYVQLVEHAPELWGMVFGKTDNPQVAQRLNRIKRAFPSASRGRLRRYFERFNPDVVLCTHYLPLETLAEMRERSTTRALEATHSPLIVSIITDFEAHALWMERGVDLYCVAAEETKTRLIARGAGADRIVATGIPIAAKFAARPLPAQVRKKLGLRDDQPILLVLSGGFGMGPVGEILAELDKAADDFQVLVVTGRNESLRSELAGQDRSHPTHVLGFTTNMHELMAVADLIITKPGGLTTSEVLATGRPMLIINPIPGQEAANSDFLLEHGAAVKINRVEDLSFRIQQLLAGRKLAEMRRASKRLGHPHAARDICTEVLKRVTEKSAVNGSTAAPGSG